jgi:energy-coupling factor transporter transmembrane protein EcfT
MFYHVDEASPVWQMIEPFTLRGYDFPGLALSLDGAQHGLAQSLRVIAVTLAGLSVALSTSPERLLVALAQLRMPRIVCFTTVTALRFLPVAFSEWSTARRARAQRGYRVRAWRVWRYPAAFSSEVALFLPVLVSALRRADTLATAVASRGFDPSVRRTQHAPLSDADRRLLVAIAAASGVLLAVDLWLR